MLVRSRLIAALAAATLAATACGADDGGASDPSGLVSEALTEVPAVVLDDADDGIQLVVGDLVAAAEVAGLERTPADDIAEAGDWLGALSGFGDAPIFVPSIELHEPEIALLAGEDFVSELGWSFARVERFVELSAPPARLTVVRGEGIAPADGLDEVGGALSVGAGADFELDPDVRSFVRPLGRPLRLRADDDAVVVSLSTAAALAWRSDEATLADDPLYADAASSLDEVGVVAAMLFPGLARPVASVATGVLDPDEAGELLGAPAIDAPFLMTGLGWYAVDGDARARVVYVFTDADTASAQVPLIEELVVSGVSLVSGEPIAELVTLDAIAADGQVVALDVAFPAGRPPSTVLSMYRSGEIIFLAG
ncbi:MAG: hypothetical protein AAGA17_16740 [Actinomycetota bacterium]